MLIDNGLRAGNYLFDLESISILLRVTSTLGMICVLTGCQSASTVQSQSIPSDLTLLAISGGLEPWSENRSIRIVSDGSAIYTRFFPGDIGADPIESSEFTLAREAMEELWLEIQQADFFSLEELYTDDNILGGSFLILEVSARGESHGVRVENLPHPVMEHLLEVINRLIPEGTELQYDAPDSLQD